MSRRERIKKLQPGLYDLLLSERNKEAVQEAESSGDLRSFSNRVEYEAAPLYLTRHVGGLLLSALRGLGNSDEGLRDQLALTNQVIDMVAKHVDDFSIEDYATSELLTALVETAAGLGQTDSPERPHIPLSTSDLLVNDSSEPAIGSQLSKEIRSADRIDLIVSFLKGSGLAILRDALAERLSEGVTVRVVTTSYMGVTETRVLTKLAEMGADIRVSHAPTSRLHAKAWLFHRNSEFSTAFVGSSNLSRSAQTSGLEWNVRLSQVETPHILKKFEKKFEQYWNDEDFEEYDANRFQVAIDRYRKQEEAGLHSIQLRPYPFQKEMLEALSAARQLHNRTRNLVVAATGTGKTVIAALDYKNVCREEAERRSDKIRRLPSLLFIAHRQEILNQAIATFRSALDDGSFGEQFFSGRKPKEGKHVFASVQTMANVNLNAVNSDAYDVIIIDEFHHASAPTYKRIRDHFKPRYLLGLTATPERTDGIDVTDLFGGEPTTELRLWDAIDRQLLVPFQYFGLHDNVDLSDVKWKRGRYDHSELEARYVDNSARVRLILSALTDHFIDTDQMRAIGFCVGVDHARFMAEAFQREGIEAVHLTGAHSDEERQSAINNLKRGEINVIFAVDIFNEGVDIPAVDTALFLRPTESSTLFLQQLGRGLRLHEGKDCLMVFDFIGRAHKEFRFDQKFRALTGQRRAQLLDNLEKGFPQLPAGCSLQLDRQSRELVFESVRSSLKLSKNALINEVVSYGHDVTLEQFVRDSGIELEEVYRGSRTWTDIKRAVEGIDVADSGPDASRLDRALGRILHMDDPDRLHLYENTLASSQVQMPAGERERRMLAMLLVSLFGGEATSDLEGALRRLYTNPATVAELLELLPILHSRIRHLPVEFATDHPIPLKLHCSYTRDEIMAAFNACRDDGQLLRPREGLFYDRASKSNLMFVTLRKTEEEYTPTTMYRDYALSPNEFHWQSQSTTRPDTDSGRRHIDHEDLGISPLLFVRETKKSEFGTTQPYMFLGRVSIESHSGERPINIVWRLESEMPGDMLKLAQAA